ncbi:hypothetical protein A3C37_04690 [Candidatus Peribacteria bacterium RIFCSPHIGHO2_02_FULL_53_20]|nr:MAG: hypothetical protein A3C37_04690 [Candidatus Peribacteria bacterium RIFCSPHIGHO2_02_FULL_53_20]OGJ67239.1 MAG: hypothetical protein A3B61_02535 [Candidatus Peribacteria bacterium RIFCSPLOWO2_01_FULL_53_10]OGJ70656.1 MAG: hypothetical protein A3G69_04460 [Candidatus Peribacteria bacterium RIFCSPLOWO2_12_FULL_53_10]
MTPQAPSIRAIVARFSFPFSERSLEAVFERCPFAFCGIISTGEPRFYSHVPRDLQEWFSSSEIRGCDYAGVDWSTISPLDEALVEEMRPCEVVFLEMVSRLEWKRSISYSLRKQWYLRHLQFWNDYIDKKKINLYIAAWLPHEIPDIVIYHLCKLKKIPALYFHTSSIRDNSFAEHDIEKSAEQIGKRYEELLREYSGVTDLAQMPLGEEFAARFEALSVPAGQKPPVEGVKRLGYWGQVRKTLCLSPVSGLRFIAGYCTPGGLRRAVEGIKRSRMIRARDAYYDAHAIDPDLTARFVYLPLHFQPEASTVPMGGAFSDQNMVAALLNAHLPDDVFIYVKEHPRASSWLARTVPMYQELLAMNKVRFIRRSADTFTLREKCIAVATVTGTAGFEGLFRGKPVFLFGYRFYQYARGVYRIRTAEDMKSAIRAVFVEGKKPSLVEARLYLQAMEETGIRGILNPWHMKVSHMAEEEHVKNNSEAIIKELDQLYAP